MQNELTPESSARYRGQQLAVYATPPWHSSQELVQSMFGTDRSGRARTDCPHRRATSNYVFPAVMSTARLWRNRALGHGWEENRPRYEVLDYIAANPSEATDSGVDYAEKHVYGAGDRFPGALLLRRRRRASAATTPSSDSLLIARCASTQRRIRTSPRRAPASGGLGPRLESPHLMPTAGQKGRSAKRSSWWRPSWL